MKFKKITMSVFAILLAALMVLSGCKAKEQTEGETPDGGEAQACTHASAVLANVKEATCTEDGYSGDGVCPDCQQAITGHVVEKLGHKNDAGTVTKIATCVQTGVMTYTCERCLLESTEVIAQLEVCNNEYHYESDSNHKMVCRDCHASSNGEHTQGELVSSVNATCTEGAYTVYLCADCDSHYKVYDESHGALGHNWDEDNPVSVAATCMTAGSDYFRCLNDGCEERGRYVELPANPTIHTYQSVSKTEATCSAEGSETFQCVDCGNYNTKVLPKTVHTYGEPEVDGNWTRNTCLTCGHKVAVFSAADSSSANVNTADMDDDKAFKIELKDAQIEFPADIVSEMKNGSSVTINADIADKDSVLAGGNMSEEDREALSSNSAKIYDFGVSGIDASSFQKNVTVTLPYTLSDGEDPEGIVIWYLNNAGEVEAVDNVQFIDDDGDGTGEVVFEVSHFSHYAIAYKETPEMRCRKGLHDFGNESRYTVVEPTCEGYGYTLKICSVCGHYTITNIKSPLSHDYGDMIQPVVTCEKGGYVYRECSKCHGRKNYEYIPSTGHTPEGYATCDTSVTCSTCHGVVVAAYGHSWSDWNITKSESGTESLKRRNCPRCGATESIKISNPTAEPWTYDSLSDLLEIVFAEFVGVSNGEISIKLPSYEGYTTMEGVVNSNNGEYTAVLDVTGGEEQFTLYYINGQCVAYSPEYDESYVVDVDKILPYDFDKFTDMLQVSFETSDEQARQMFDAMNAFASMLTGEFADEIDGILASVGVDFKAANLADIIELQQTLYAYYSTKLGLQTTVAMPAELNGEYINKVLGAVMQAEAVDGGTKYIYNASDVYTAISAVIEYIEARVDNTYADYIYEAVGSTVMAAKPEVTSFDALMNLVKTEFSGNVQVRVFVDKITAAIAQSGTYTIDDIYDAIDSYAALMGARMDMASQINQFAELTMDQLAQMIMGDESATVAQLYDGIQEMLKSKKIGETVIDREYVWNSNGTYDVTDVTLADKLAEIKQALAAVTVNGTVEITVSADGSIGGINFNLSIGMTEGEQTNTIEYKVTAKNSDKVATIPDDIRALSNPQVSFTYDGNGNLIIAGGTNIEDIEIEIDGSVKVKLADVVTLDSGLSEELGYDVYVLDKAYWTETYYVGEYLIDGDGKLYAMTGEHYVTPASIISKAKLDDALSTPENYLPAENATPAGYWDNNGEQIAVYTTVFGYVYKESGEWKLVDAVTSNIHGNWSSYENKYVVDFYNLKGVPFSAAIESIQISNFQSEWYRDAALDGATKVHVGRLYVSIEGIDDNVGLNAAIYDDQIYLLEMRESYDRYIYTVGSPLDSSVQYDVMYNSYSGNDIYENGQKTDKYNVVTLYQYVPSYYAQYDGNYFYLNENYKDTTVIGKIPFAKVDVSELEALALTDGRTLYVVSRVGDVEYEASIYGYIHVGNGLYVCACAKYENSQLTELIYRNDMTAYSECATKYLSLYSSNINTLISQYLVSNTDGTYTITADGVKLMNSLCANKGDYISIAVSGKITSGDKAGEFRIVEPIACVVPESVSGYSSEHIYWRDEFGQSDEDEMGVYSYYNIVVKDDGSILVTSKDGSDIDIDFRFNEDTVYDNISGDEFLTYNQELSTEHGVDVYTGTSTEQYSGSYVYFGGAYYYLNVQENHYLKSYKSTTLEALKSLRYRLGSLYYQYDEVDESGAYTGARIYSGNLWFDSNTQYADNCNRSSGYSSKNCYFKMQDGILYVLTGVEELGDSIIKYEGAMTLTEYISSLRFVSTNTYEAHLKFLNGTKVYVEDFDVYEGERYVCRVSYCYYIANGQKEYLIVEEEDIRYIYDLGERVTMPSSWFVDDRETVISENRTLDIVNIHWYENIENQHFVKVNDLYVRLDYYLSRFTDESSFYWELGEITYIYGVQTEGGAVEYYGNWQYDFSGDEAVITLLEAADVSGYSKLVRGNRIGVDASGREVYEYSAYTLNVDTYTLASGEIMYCAQNTTRGYIKLDNGSYLEGYLVQDENGEYEFNIFGEWYYYDEVLDANDVIGSLKLRDYITFNGSSMVIDAGIAEALAKCADQCDYILFRGGHYGSYAMQFSEFMALLNK